MSATWADVDGGRLAVVDEGAGEPVLCIGGGILADAFAPLCAQPGFAAGRRTVRYHRRGLGRSTAPPEGSIAGATADAFAVLEALGIGRAHLVGWSYGGLVALDAALERPGAVASVTLLEPALLLVPAAAELQPAFAAAGVAFAAGDVASALDLFHAAIGLPDWRAEDERIAPGTVAQAEWDAGTAFGHDLPAVGAWLPGAERVRGITAPTALVTGGATAPLFVEIRALVLEWLPGTEDATLPGADHSFPFTRAAELAGPLAAVLDRHAGVREPV